jgi:uncharacterized membrane protein YgcG
MVVLAASLLTKGGRVLVSRQFVEMTRMRIEGLLATFPKLLGTGNKQHTFIDTETVRYIYQPLESLVLVIITTKASNIVEDLETLRLLSKIIPDVAGGLAEGDVTSNCFDLIFAFDELIYSGGYKENMTISQIKANLEMDSEEEKKHKLMMDVKEKDAKEEMKRRMVQIKEDQAKRGMSAPSGFGGGGGGGGMNLDGGGGGGGGDGGGGGGGDGEVVQTTASPFDSKPVEAAEPARPIRNVGGMSLGGKPKGMSLMSAMASEEGIKIEAAPKAQAAGAAADMAAPAPAPAAPVSNDPINLVSEEKITCSMNQEGAAEAMEIKGSLALTANQEGAAACVVSVELGSNPEYKFQTHPKIDKKAWEAGQTLGLKGGAAFPLGKPVGVLRWTFKPSDPTPPLTINCWPEDEGGGRFNVNIEYTLENTGLELHDVNILIPLGTDVAPEIVDCSGVYKHNAANMGMVWHMDMIDASNSTGTLEFNIDTGDSSCFFPVHVAFTSKQMTCQLKVASVNTTDGEAARYGYSQSFSTDQYIVQ